MELSYQTKRKLGSIYGQRKKLPPKTFLQIKSVTTIDALVFLELWGQGLFYKDELWNVDVEATHIMISSKIEQDLYKMVASRYFLNEKIFKQRLVVVDLEEIMKDGEIKRKFQELKKQIKGLHDEGNIENGILPLKYSITDGHIELNNNTWEPLQRDNLKKVRLCKFGDEFEDEEPEQESEDEDQDEDEDEDEDDEDEDSHSSFIDDDDEETIEMEFGNQSAQFDATPNSQDDFERMNFIRDYVRNHPVPKDNGN